MSKNYDKPIDSFSRKEKEAFKLVMRALDKRPMTRRAVYALVRNAGIYQTKKHRKDVIEMLWKNENTPIELNDGQLVNTLAKVEA